MVYFGDVRKIEVTTDKDKVNELLNEDWLLLSAIETATHEFIFLVGLYDYSSEEFLGRRRKPKDSNAAKTI